MLVAGVALSLAILAMLPETAEPQEDTNGAWTQAEQNTTKDTTIANENAGALAVSRPANEPSTRLVVYPGDTLWWIAQERLGPNTTPQQIVNEVERIYQLNRALIGDDPDLILPGQELLLPTTAGPAEVAPADEAPAAPAAPAATAAALADEPSALPVSEQPAEEAAPAPAEEAAPAPAEEAQSFLEPYINDIGLLNLGFNFLLFAFALLATIFMVWKLRQTRRDLESTKSARTLSDPEDGTLAKKHDTDHVGLAGVTGIKRKEIVRVRAPATRRPLRKKRLASNVYSPQVRRFYRGVP
jgi:hypothetical protein